MGKGVSETFDEHEEDTRRRAYAKEVFERAKRTEKMPKLEVPRTESGTRLALTRGQVLPSDEAAIDRHLRAQIQDALDPHSRPTIEVTDPNPAAVFHTLPMPILTPANVAANTIERETPSVMMTPIAAPPSTRASRSRWLISAFVAAMVVLLVAASVMGFVLGRRTLAR